MQANNLIVVGGQDVTKYLYGNSSRILFEMDGMSDRECLQAFRDAVASVDSRTTWFGVRLMIPGKNDGQKGSKLLALRIEGSSVHKTIFEVTDRAEKNGKEYISTRGLFPEYYADGEGFFPAEELVKPLSSMYPTLYLAYYGPIPQRHRDDPKLPFYDKIMWLATDFNLLVECWALAHSPELRQSDAFSHDPFEGYWRREFGRKHSRSFEHDLVWRQLTGVLMEGDMRGINRIYDTSRWETKDLISPLLFQMQTDILEKLYEDESLLGYLFGENVSEYWKKRLAVIVENYYGPKGIVHIEQRRVQVQPLVQVDHHLLHRLERIIKESHFEGEKEAARRLYKRMMGRDFVA